MLPAAGLIAGLMMAGHIAPVSAAGAKDGEALAIEHCRRCHVIPGQNNMGIGSTPSFKIMVKSKAKDWRDKFEAFFSLPPHPNFVRIKEFRAPPKSPSVIVPIVLSLDDVDSLMAYVDSLAKDLRKQ
ncbi:MAG: hypothetical protein HKN11_08255 [Rhizobiales bacterium]|nr:hypothetical protein [Hyphomicrobiales bacterium]